jgi:hypothetical protein
MGGRKSTRLFRRTWRQYATWDERSDAELHQKMVRRRPVRSSMDDERQAIGEAAKHDRQKDQFEQGVEKPVKP